MTSPIENIPWEEVIPPDCIFVGPDEGADANHDSNVQQLADSILPNVPDNTSAPKATVQAGHQGPKERVIQASYIFEKGFNFALRLLGKKTRGLSQKTDWKSYEASARAKTPYPIRISNFQETYLYPQNRAALEEKKQVQLTDGRTISCSAQFIKDLERTKDSNYRISRKDGEVFELAKNKTVYDAEGKPYEEACTLEEKLTQYWPELLAFADNNEEKAQEFLLYLSQGILADCLKEAMKCYENKEFGLLTLVDISKEYSLFTKVIAGKTLKKMKGVLTFGIKRYDEELEEALWSDGNYQIPKRAIIEVHLDEPYLGRAKVYFENVSIPHQR